MGCFDLANGGFGTCEQGMGPSRPGRGYTSGRVATRSRKGTAMHEMALVHQVVDTVLEQVRGTDVAEVTAVHLTICVGRDVIEDYMSGLFSFVARGTAAEHAQLVIRRVPYTVRCNQCGEIFPINVRDSSTWVCPQCEAVKDYRLFSGMEFMIDSISVSRRPVTLSA